MSENKGQHSNEQHRVGLVTGAARGIGAAAAVALAQRGITPVLLVRDPDRASGTVAAVRATGRDCEVVAADVAHAEEVTRAIDQILERFGRLDILVNNAGVIDPIGRIGDTDPGDWARSLSVNLLGPYHCIHAALPALRKGPTATIVNVSSGAAHAPREGWSAYCSSKAGLEMLTRAVALEYAADGLAVYGLQPGVVDTEMQVRIRASGINEVSRIPREQLAPAERSARWIAWLADRRPQDLIGQDLSVRDASLAARIEADQD